MRSSALARAVPPLVPLILCLGFGLALSACGDDGGVGPNDDGRGIDATSDACVGLQCMQVECPGGGTTSLHGHVYAPNGTLPLYNAIVYVPNAPLEPFTDGASCDQCDEALSGDPVVRTTTDTTGYFRLDNVPVTGDLPLVIKIGKWRRELRVPAVTMCTDAEVPAADTRLPRSQTDGVGHIPKMALSTGGADALECMLRKIGLDDSEFTPAGGTGRVRLYAGIGGTAQFAANLSGGAAFANSTTLWDTPEHLKQYDVVFLSCEGGGQHLETKPQSSLDAMGQYADTYGGRVFMSHWHSGWIQHGPALWQATTQFNFQADLGNVTADIDTSFPRAADLAQWLMNVGGSTTLGKVDLIDAQHTVTSVDTTKADRWIWVPNTAQGPSVQYLSFTTPLNEPIDNRCGRVVMSDIHVSTGDDSATGLRFPGGCTTTGLTAQEKVLAFMIFDIAGCVGTPIP